MPRQDLFSHPKFRRLVHILGMPEPHVLGHLEYLWRVGYDSGEPFIGDGLDVEIAAHWTGEPGALVRALADPAVRLLDVVSDGYQIHDLHRNAPDFVRRKFQRHQARNRPPNPPSGRSVTSQSPVTDDQVPVSDRPVTTKGGSTIHLSGVERSRVEQSRTSKTTTGTDVGFDVEKPSTSKPASTAPPEPSLVTFPTAGAPSQWSFTQSQLDQWTTAYPGVDVLAEVRKALAWVQAQGRHKTAAGMPRFLVSWLGRTNDQRRGSPHAVSKTAGNAEAIASFIRRGTG